MKKNPLIFIVEDDFMMSEMIYFQLNEEAYTNLESYTSGDKAVENLYKMPDIIICDYHLHGEMNGEAVLKNVKAFSPDIQVIMLSGQEKMEVAVNSLKFGAFDYVVKDDTAMDKVVELVKKIEELNRKVSKKNVIAKMKNKFF